jgi:uncharacterized protein YicC (UPF0701 family)
MEDSAPIEAGSASLQKVRKRYDTLTDLIGSLSSKLNNVSVHQEKDFLLAYRVHQVDIQQELKELKQRVAQAETSLIEDGAVARMEDECSWFRSETTRLQNHCSAMRKDMAVSS